MTFIYNDSAVETFPETGTIIIRNPKVSDQEPPKTFTFDSVFGPNVEQKHIYNTCASSVVESVLQGYNGTIFAYGQVFNSSYCIKIDIVLIL